MGRPSPHRRFLLNKLKAQGLRAEVLEAAAAEVGDGSICCHLIQRDLIEHEAVEQIYDQLAESLQRWSASAVERRRSQALAEFLTGWRDGQLAPEQIKATRTQIIKGAPGGSLVDRLLTSGQLSAAEATAARRAFDLEFGSCPICGESTPRAVLIEQPWCPQCEWPYPEAAAGKGTVPLATRQPPDADEATAAPVSILDAPEHDPVLDQLHNRCRLRKRLGKGGMGTVYLGHHEVLQIDVAVKLLSQELSQIPEWRDRFIREARMAARLNHPNLMRVFDVGESHGRWSIVMELLRGESYQEIIRREPLSWEEALYVIRESAQGLQALHDAGMVHRDLKPDNLFRTVEGRVVITDFGLARDQQDSDLTRTGTILGTPAYLPPEQADGHPTDARSDIFSLGVTFAALMIGHSPFARANILATIRAIADEPLPPLPPDAPPDARNVLRKMCAKKASERYEDCGQLLRALARLPRRS